MYSFLWVFRRCPCPSNRFLTFFPQRVHSWTSITWTVDLWRSKYLACLQTVVHWSQGKMSDSLDVLTLSGFGLLLVSTGYTLFEIWSPWRGLWSRYSPYRENYWSHFGHFITRRSSRMSVCSLITCSRYVARFLRIAPQTTHLIFYKGGADLESRRLKSASYFIGAPGSCLTIWESLSAVSSEEVEALEDSRGSLTLPSFGAVFSSFICIFVEIS